MTGLLALALAGAESPTSAPLDPIRVFEDVCVAGTGHFPTGSLRPLAGSVLPQQLRSQVRPSPSATIYRAVHGGALVIIVEPRAASGEQYCRVYSEALDKSRLTELGFKVDPRIASCGHNCTSREVGWETWSNYGYVLTARRIGASALLLTAHLFASGDAKRHATDIEVLQTPGTPQSSKRDAATRLQAAQGNAPH